MAINSRGRSKIESRIGQEPVPRIDADQRGVKFQADGDWIVAAPSGLLSNEEQNSVRHWRWHVLGILAE